MAVYFSASLLASTPQGSIAVDLLFVTITPNTATTISYPKFANCFLKHYRKKKKMQKKPIPCTQRRWRSVTVRHFQEVTDRTRDILQDILQDSFTTQGCRQRRVTVRNPSGTQERGGVLVCDQLPRSGLQRHPAITGEMKTKSTASYGWSACQWAIFEIYQLLMANFVLHE